MKSYEQYASDPTYKKIVDGNQVKFVRYGKYVDVNRSPVVNNKRQPIPYKQEVAVFVDGRPSSETVWSAVPGVLDRLDHTPLAAMTERGMPVGTGHPRCTHSQYTNTNRPSQTTSTKCQYQATASKAKWLCGLKWRLAARKSTAASMIAPMVTWKPWKPVSM